MYYNRFQQGDEVQYAGSKEHLAKELNGKMGTVISRVGGEESVLCVDFNGDAYLMDEQTELARFVKRPQRPEGEQQKGGPEVHKRRGGGAPEGGKRRNQEEE